MIFDRYGDTVKIPSSAISFVGKDSKNSVRIKIDADSRLYGLMSKNPNDFYILPFKRRGYCLASSTLRPDSYSTRYLKIPYNLRMNNDVHSTIDYRNLSDENISIKRISRKNYLVFVISKNIP
jgi:hypothetical protein